VTGNMSVELAMEKEARKVALKGKVAQPQDFDSVLRAHCRLDQEG
jgi:hypothetical protein